MNFDVGIIGGGVIGLSCAWRLAQAGARVAIFERGQIGREASWAAAGMLAAQCEAAHHAPNEDESSTRSRAAMFDLCLQSRALYSQFADELFDATDVDIELSLKNHNRNDWRSSGILYVQTCDDDAAFANFARQKKSGNAVENAPNFNGFRAAFLPDEGQVENRVLVKALNVANEKAGVAIYENEDVLSVKVTGNSSHEIETAKQKTVCENILLCSGASASMEAFSDCNSALVHPVAGQMLALRPKDRLQNLAQIIYASDVYIVPRRDGRVVVGATVENVGFEKRITQAAREELLRKATRLVPELAASEVEDQWIGLRPQTRDGLPILGSTPLKNFYVATGHYRNGILLAPITAKLMADCILHNIEPPREFAIARFQK